MDTITNPVSEARAAAEKFFTPIGANSKPSDAVNLPAHYADYKIEPITFIMANSVPFAEGNVIKYTMRHANKNGAEDVRKAIRYLEFVLENTYGEKL